MKKEIIWCGVCGKDITKEYEKNPEAIKNTPNNACENCRKTICPQCGNKDNPPIRFCEECGYEWLTFEEAENG